VLRGLTAILVSSIAAGGAMATDASLPNDPLHDLKMTTEQLRLDLAKSPEQKVAVLLDIAQARLHEADVLEATDRPVEASAAVSAYGESVARAAAQLEELPGGLLPTAAKQFRVDVAKQQADVLGSQSIAASAPLGYVAEMAASVARSSNAQPHEIAAAAANAAEQAAAGVERQVTPVASTAAARVVVAASSGSSSPESAVTVRRESAGAVLVDAHLRPTPGTAASASVTPPTATPGAAVTEPLATVGSDSKAEATTPQAPPVKTSPAQSTTSVALAAPTRTPASTTTSAATSRAVVPPVAQSQTDNQNQAATKTLEAAAKAARESSDRAKQAADRAKRASDTDSQGAQSRSQ
jgi:hypothetical protein